jgi:hypothetical protein
MAEYPNTVPRTLTDYFGDYLSALSFGAKGDGVTDDAPAINTAITSLIGLGGRDLYFPGGRTYTIKTPVIIPAGASKMRFVGDGAATLFKRGAAMPANKGMFDIQGASHVEFDNFMVDGNVLTSTGVAYSAFSGDPMNAILTQDSTFWIHGGSYIRFNKVRIIHTGGYAILLDARTANITDVRINELSLENCRPHLFGNAGDLTYGSWTGGVHVQGDGNSFSVDDFYVTGSSFKRVTGNALWSHLYALNKLHSNYRFSDNHFIDCGLDGIQLGGVVGGVVKGNTFRRIGYVATDDTSTSVPKWMLGSAYAVGLDTAGRVTGVNYEGNTFLNVNGGCIDLDGYGRGTVMANTCIVSRPGEPEYNEDQVGSPLWGSPGQVNRNWVYGAQVSNSNNDSIAGDSPMIVGNTFVNCGGGAIRLYATRKGMVVGNNIDHSSDAPGVPITIGNIGTGPFQRSYDNVVTDNKVHWSPAFPSAVVYEDAQFGAFQAGDKNWVFNNKINGTNTNAYELNKNPNTSTSTRLQMVSAQPSQDRGNEAILQREGPHTAAYTRLYSQVNGVSTPQATFTDDGVMNLRGVAGQGAYATGNRTTIGMKDSVNTGKLFGDAFLVLTDTTYLSSDANLFNNTYGLIRYDKTAHQFMASVNVDGSGNRIWTTFGAGAAAGSTGQVQYNSGGAFAASADMSWDSAARLLTLTGTAGQAVLLVNGGYIQSAQGYYTIYAQGDAFHAPNGGVTANTATVKAAAYNAINLIGTGASNIDWGGVNAYQYSFVGRSSVPPLSGSGTAKMYCDSNGQVKVSQNGGAWANILTSALSFTTLTVSGNAGAASITAQAGYMQSAEGFYSVASVGNVFNAPNGGITCSTGVFTSNAYNAIQITGINTASQFANGAQSVDWGGLSAYQLCLKERNILANVPPPNSSSGEAKFWLGGGSVRLSTNGGPYNVLLTESNAVMSLGVLGIGALYGNISLVAGTGINLSVNSAQNTITITNTNVGGSGSGVTQLNGLTGALALQGSGGITVGATGTTITLSFVGGAIVCSSLEATGTNFNQIKTNGGFQGATLQVTGSNVNAILATTGGCTVADGYYIGSTRVINSNKQFVGFGVDVQQNGIRCGGVNIAFDSNVGGASFSGRTAILTDRDGNTMIFRGGILTVS